jgi:hypothetical protein
MIATAIGPQKTLGATLLTLLFLPALYATWFRVQSPAAEPGLAAAVLAPGD